QLAGKVVAVHARHAEIRVNPFAVGDGRLGGVGVRGLFRDRRLVFGGKLLPKNLAAVTVETDDFPAIHLVRRPASTPRSEAAAAPPAETAARRLSVGASFAGKSSAGASETAARFRLVLLLGACGRHKHFVAPHDWGRPAEARNGDLPKKVLAPGPLFRN